MLILTSMGFQDLIGNNRVKKILSSYIKNGKIPASIMFYGPRSADIESFALSFAKAVNCKGPDSKVEFCGKCDSCIEISKGIFPDVNIIYPDGMYYKKEQIFFLIEENIRRPLSGEKKIFIISDASRMNENSSNSFLKVLEEPSESTIFILLTNNYNNILSTIKSRCQLIRFYRPSKKELKMHFRKIGFDEEKALLLSSLSQSERSDIQVEDYYGFLENRSEKFVLFEKLIRNSGSEEVLIQLFRLSGNRNKFIPYFTEFVNLLSLFIRDIIIIKIGSGNEYIINSDFIEKLEELEVYIGIEKLIYLIYRMEQIVRDVNRNLNSKILVWEFFKSFN